MKIDAQHITVVLVGSLKRNAPVRGKNMPASWSARKRINYLKPTKTSPYPGNLKDNGIVAEISETSSRIEIGGPRAPYGERTEITSFSPGWIAKSNSELLDKLRQAGGKVR